MARFTYTGRADALEFNGKLYGKPALARKNPDMYDGDFDSPIPGMDENTARRLVNRSNLHSFDVDNADLMEQLTRPDNAPDPAIVVPKGVKDDAKKPASEVNS